MKSWYHGVTDQRILLKSVFNKNRCLDIWLSVSYIRSTPPTTTGDATYSCKGDANNFVIYNWWQEKQYGASQESFDPTYLYGGLGGQYYADSSAYFIVNSQIQTELLVNHAHAVRDKRDSYSGKLIVYTTIHKKSYSEK